jgi:hypothetical protein
LKWTSILLDIIPQSLIYRRLVSPAFTLSFILKPLQDIRIDEDRDPGFALLRDNRPSLALAKVIFPQHFILFAHKLSAPLGLLIFSRLLKNTQLLRSYRLSSLQRTSKYASLLRISRALHMGIFEKPVKTFYEAIFSLISAQRPTYTKRSSACRVSSIVTAIGSSSTVAPWENSMP